MFIPGNARLCGDICKALGFDHVISLQLNMAVNDAVTVTVKKIVTVEETKALAEVLSRYAIEATQVEPPPETF